MSNSILTIDMITRKALEIFENNLVITRNVNRQYDDSFAVEGAKIGSTLRIRLPDRALVTDGAALQVQDDNEPVDSRVCGLTALQALIVNTSPALMVVDTEPCSNKMEVAPSAVTPGVLTNVEADALREPVVCCLID